MGACELRLRFMRNYELWVNVDYGEDKHTATKKHLQKHRHINTMTRPGLWVRAE